jgi:hypothetical protein
LLQSLFLYIFLAFVTLLLASESLFFVVNILDVSQLKCNKNKDPNTHGFLIERMNRMLQRENLILRQLPSTPLHVLKWYKMAEASQISSQVNKSTGDPQANSTPPAHHTPQQARSNGRRLGGGERGGSPVC